MNDTEVDTHTARVNHRNAIKAFLANPPTDAIILRGHRNGGGATIAIDCPFCGKRHTHGAGHMVPGIAEHRVPHCDEPKFLEPRELTQWRRLHVRGYYIELTE